MLGRGLGMGRQEKESVVSCIMYHVTCVIPVARQSASWYESVVRLILSFRPMRLADKVREVRGTLSEQGCRQAARISKLKFDL